MYRVAPPPPVPADSTRAIASSIALHALVAALVLAVAAPLHTMPHQIINISMVAAPSSSPKTKHQPVQDEAEKSEPAKESTKILVKKAEKGEVMAEKNVQPSSPPAAAQSALPEQVAGDTPEAPPATQLVMTSASFEASTLNNPAPEYPSQAKRRGMEGLVMLRVVVTEEGLARTVSVAKTSGFAMLDSSAVETVRRWKFIPARQGNQPVTAQVMVPIEFRLQ